MKHIVRCVTVFLCTLLLTGVLAFAADAAVDIYPEQVKTIKASPATTSVTVKWEKVPNASGYCVYQVSGNSYKYLKKVSSSSVKITGLKEAKTYKFAVKAYRAVDKKTYKSKLYSPIVTVKTKATIPSKPSSLKAISGGSRQVGLTWKKVSNAVGYEIYRVKDGVKTRVASISKNSTVEYTVGGLTNGQSASFCMRSYRLTSDKRKIYSDYTSVVSATPKPLSSAARDIHSIYYTAKTKRKLTVYNYTKKKSQVLKAGQKVIAPARTISGYMTCQLPNGDKIKIKGSEIRTYGYSYDSKKDYSKAAKEELINSKNLVSETSYLVWVNQYRCRINIFKGSVGKWKLVKVFKCGIGTYDAPSPKGIRKIYSKTRYGKNGVTIIWSPGGNAFHEPLGIAVGFPSSHGCFRMRMNDLEWMYKYVPVGTLVYSW